MPESCYVVQQVGHIPEGYRMTEFGPLPEEWRVVRLGEVFDEIDRRVKSSEDSATKKLPVLSLTKNWGLILQTDRFKKRIATDDVSNYKVIRRGQIVYNPYVIWEGAIHILEKYEAGLVSPVYPVLKTKEAVADSFYLDSWLRTPPAIAAYNKFAAGAVNRRRSIRKRDFWQIEIPLPPLPEQRAIAHVLRAVKRAKDATEGVITTLRELKKSLMRHLFTYGPVSVDAIDSVELQETEIGLLPKHWQVVRLGELAAIRYGLGQPPEIDETGIPMIRATNIKAGRIVSQGLLRIRKEAIPSSRDPFLKAGDIIVVRSGAYTGDAALVTAEWEGSIVGYDLVVTSGESLLPQFCVELLLGNNAQRYFRGQRDRSAQPHLNAHQLKATLLPLPPLPEQHEIARILQTVDRKIEVEEQRKAALEALFKALLHDLMTARRRLPAEFVAQFEKESEDTS